MRAALQYRRSRCQGVTGVRAEASLSDQLCADRRRLGRLFRGDCAAGVAAAGSRTTPREVRAGGQQLGVAW
jgi:hypothetical protein